MVLYPKTSDSLPTLRSHEELTFQAKFMSGFDPIALNTLEATSVVPGYRAQVSTITPSGREFWKEIYIDPTTETVIDVYIFVAR